MRVARSPIAGSALAVAVLACLACAAAAQSKPPAIPEPVVRKMIELGLKNIHRALCDGFNQCAPATPAEFENPPLSLDQARAAILIGGRSAYVRWCGFDADRRSVLPFMQQLRQSKLYNERQLALIAVIHGIQLSIVAEQLKAKGTCDAATRNRVDAQLPKS
jgi:hypothetical protein